MLSELRVAAVNDQLKKAEEELLKFEGAANLRGIRRLHGCIQSLTEMILEARP